jgi:alkylation response protein AidB-like acyl-CoA dehydrogenase
MADYTAPSAAMAQTLIDVVQALPLLQPLPAHRDCDADLLRQVLDEAGRFVSEVVAPLNRSGDEIGAQWRDGQVSMPPGFRAAYQAFWQAGWPALSAHPDDGGQGLPVALEMALYEMLSAANHGWTMAPGLLHGACECLKHHASPEIQAVYLPRLVSGEWLATMCLTEPHAGSDLGLARTKATPLPDGRYALSGTKIFISGGDHDLTDNIVHLVLARLPDAPPGPKGLSLFLVPKFYPDGQRSAVMCDRIEEKMGLHGSPTCVLRFDEASGWLIGEPGKGLNAMFVMMNAARLHVAMQGIGLLDAAHQKASAYAQERLQMRAPQRPAERREAADPIAWHPAVQRVLRTQACWVALGRVIAYRTALELDVAHHHPDAARRQQAERWCALCTPVLKSAWTDQAFHGASACLQVLGGHGYVREWGIEQRVRDARVAMIYEGTNEIQAIDLLLRKTLPDGGAALTGLLDKLIAELHTAGSDARCAAAVAEVRDWLADLLPALQAPTNPEAGPHWVAEEVLRVTALALMAWANGMQGVRQPEADAQAFWRWVWPEMAQRRAVAAAMG